MRLDPDLVAWRAERLTSAGLTRREAFKLARDARVDLHELLELIDRGCPPALAVRITAPLDWPQSSRSATSASRESCSSRHAGHPSR